MFKEKRETSWKTMKERFVSGHIIIIIINLSVNEFYATIKVFLKYFFYLILL